MNTHLPLPPPDLSHRPTPIGRNPHARKIASTRHMSSTPPGRPPPEAVFWSGYVRLIVFIAFIAALTLIALRR